MKQLTQNLKSGEMALLEEPFPALAKGQVQVRNHYSVISAGTESRTVKDARAGYLGKAKSRPEELEKVVEAIKSNGVGATYRAVMNRLDMPSPLGYSCAGEVISVGEQVREFQVGDRVACGGNGAVHSEIVSVPKNLCVKVPDDVDLKFAAFSCIAAIALQGVRQADLRLGETGVVIGLGLIGQLTLQLLDASGVQAIGIDIDPRQVRLAEEMGGSLVFHRAQPGLAEKVLDHTKGYGADAVIITAATNSLDPVELAGELCRQKGKVVVVGGVPTGFSRGNYYRKELELRMSCSYGPGRYDPLYEDKGVDYPIGYVRWTENRNMQAFLDLLRDKKLNLEKLVTHTFDFEQAEQAYELILNGEEPYLGVVLKYDTAQSLQEKIELNGKHAETAFEKSRDRRIHDSPEPVLSEAEGSVLSEAEGLPMKGVLLHPDGDPLHPERSRRMSGPKGPNSDQTTEVNIGFIGAGSFAQNHLLPNIGRDANLIGVATARPNNARTIADKYHFQYCTGNADDVIADDQIDTVFIATRHDLHAEYVIKALQAGKHVFVEKPLAMTLEELEEIKEVYLSRNNFGFPKLMLGFNRRFAPQIRKVKEAFQNAGPMAINYRINAGYAPPEHWIHDDEVGGGRIVGEVCHFVDLCVFLTGSKIASVSAQALDTPHDLWDSVVVNLAFENGSIATIGYFSNGSNRLKKERLEVFCAGEVAVIDDFTRLVFYNSAMKKSRERQDKGHREEIAQFLTAIWKGAPAPISFEDLHHSTLAAFKILESIRNRATIRL